MTKKFWIRIKKGVHVSPETEFEKGSIPMNKGKTYEELYGVERASEMKKKQSEQRKGRSMPFKGKIKRSEELKERISKTKKRLYAEGKIKTWNKGLTKEINGSLARVSKKLSAAMKGKHHSLKTEFTTERMKELWKNKDYIKTLMKAMQRKPNKKESILNEILQNSFPNKWAYNGDFNLGVSIGRKIPDFVNTNGKKAVIEMFGDYWHNREGQSWHRTEFGTKAIYSQYGFKTLVIYENELKKPNEVIEKIGKFMEDIPE